MAPLTDLKEKRLPAHKEGTSSVNCKHLLRSAALPRNEAREVFDRTTKKPMEDDEKVKADEGNTAGLDKADLDELKAENKRTHHDFISVLPVSLLGTARKATSDAFPEGCGHTGWKECWLKSH